MRLSPDRIKQYYLEGFKEKKIHKEWPQLWNKQFKLVTTSHVFHNLNRIKDRLRFNALRDLCINFQPAHLYMSALNWLMPERVGTKHESRYAYPIGGEYIVDVDHHLNYHPHRHYTTEDGICKDCLGHAKKLTEEVLDIVTRYYTDVHLVFSGKDGFHIHVLDFKVRDWAYYDVGNPLKSQEIARVEFTKLLSKGCPKAFDRHHFVVSNDVCRVVTFPESINGETGVTCSYLGSPGEFKDMKIDTIVNKAKRSKEYTIGLNWTVASEWKNPRFNVFSP